MKMKTLSLFLGLFFTLQVCAYDNVFYCTYQTKTCVDSSAELNMNAAEVSELLKLVGAGVENFLGFVDSQGTTIQFFVEGEEQVLVEVPIPAKKGSYGKKINQTEMRTIVENLNQPYLKYIDVLELKFKPW